MAGKDLLYSTGNSTLHSIMACMGKEPKKEWMIYIYMYVTDFGHEFEHTPVGSCPSSRKGSDTTECVSMHARAHIHTHIHTHQEIVEDRGA